MILYLHKSSIFFFFRVSHFRVPVGVGRGKFCLGEGCPLMKIPLNKWVLKMIRKYVYVYVKILIWKTLIII